MKMLTPFFVIRPKTIRCESFHMEAHWAGSIITAGFLFTFTTSIPTWRSKPMFKTSKTSKTSIFSTSLYSIFSMTYFWNTLFITLHIFTNPVHWWNYFLRHSPVDIRSYFSSKLCCLLVKKTKDDSFQIWTFFFC